MGRDVLLDLAQPIVEAGAQVTVNVADCPAVRNEQAAGLPAPGMAQQILPEPATACGSEGYKSAACQAEWRPSAFGTGFL
jgi:hypothetical protein